MNESKPLITNGIGVQLISRVAVLGFGWLIAWGFGALAALIISDSKKWVFYGFGFVWTVGSIQGIIREIKFQRAKSI